MSSLWTPGGEHEVPRQPPPEPAGAPADAPPALEVDPEIAAALEAMSPEERAQAEQILAERAQAMAEQRAAIAQAPAAVVIANHVMGLHELAAIHLSQQPPNLEEASLAIDAMAALVDSVKGRLGEDEAVLAQALDQLRMAFVELRRRSLDGEDAAE